MDPLEEIARLHHRLREAEADVSRLRADRDQRIRDAIAGGVPAHTIARVLGISEPAVAKIKKAGMS